MIAWFIIALTACDTSDSGSSGLAEEMLTLTEDIQPILTEVCQNNCHDIDDPSNFSMTAGFDTYGNIVNAPATQAPLFDRVEPGRPDLSYLLHKIDGTHFNLGGMGTSMPKSGEISREQRNMIELWITQGARQ